MTRSAVKPAPTPMDDPSLGGLDVIAARESRVRVYSRHFPTVFSQALGAALWDERSRRYIDFFAGAGALNYGHNPPALKSRLLDYLQADGVVQGLDMATSAKAELLERFEEVILRPRSLDYRVVFPGPTGANAVECAAKIARKFTGRSTIASFTNAFHGVSLGSLALTGNARLRAGAGVALTDVVRMPFDGYLGPDVDTLGYFERVLDDRGSGVDLPAAAIVETVQAEGGLNVASYGWLKRLHGLCRRYGMLLIVDDIQVGCGRTGPFFSFEPANIAPDIVCLSKSISGYGLPMALTLVKPTFDCLDPGEHNGTFRGNNLAFVTATEALEFWRTSAFSQEVIAKGRVLNRALKDMLDQYPQLNGEVRGRGLIQGIAVRPPELAQQIARTAFGRGLILETAGAQSQVLKVMPPLVISEDELRDGLAVLSDSIGVALEGATRTGVGPAIRLAGAQGGLA